MISFRVGERDAKILEREFDDTYTANPFTCLNNYAKLLWEYERCELFWGRTLAPLNVWYGLARGDIADVEGEV
jgi:hypothetical protein